MRFCFILKEKYAHKPMPMVVANSYNNGAIRSTYYSRMQQLPA